MILAAAWKQISYNFLFFLAGLQAIPKTLVEAAAIDGAGATRCFWQIVFPLLAPISFILLVVNSRGYGAAAPHRGTGPDRATARVAEIGTCFSPLIEIFCSHPFVGYG